MCNTQPITLTSPHPELGSVKIVFCKKQICHKYLSANRYCIFQSISYKSHLAFLLHLLYRSHVENFKHFFIFSNNTHPDQTVSVIFPLPLTLNSHKIYSKAN